MNRAEAEAIEQAMVTMTPAQQEFVLAVARVLNRFEKNLLEHIDRCEIREMAAWMPLQDGVGRDN